MVCITRERDHLPVWTSYFSKSVVQDVFRKVARLDGKRV